VTESIDSNRKDDGLSRRRLQRGTLNANDGIYNSLSSSEKSALTLQTTENGVGLSGVINLGVTVG
jgi:hypothetical protein